jgi:tRNA(adenine34) deaminase
MNEDEKWMQIAIYEANVAKEENEIPVGAVIIKDGLVLARGHNQPITKNDATAHAEIQVLRNASLKEKNYRLTGTTLYVTLEPCAMCFGAMIHARVDRIVFGAYDYKSGVCGSCIDLANEKFFNHNIIITSGIFEKDCSKLLQSFFKSRR